MTQEQPPESLRSLAQAQASFLRRAVSANRMTPSVKAVWRHVESPIERLLIEAVISCERITRGEPPVIVAPGEKFVSVAKLLIAPQHWIGQHRADFAIVNQATHRRLVVECDGFEFHDRTAQDAQRDKARDRAFLRMGWPVMRFNGSEIYRKIDLCLDDIAAFLNGDET